MQTLGDGGGINEVASTQATCDVLIDVSHLHCILGGKQVHAPFCSHMQIYRTVDRICLCAHTHTHQLLFTIDQPAKNPRDSDAISRVIYTNSAIF